MGTSVITEISSKQQWSNLMEDNLKYKKMVVMFTAAWCPPCRHILPYFTEIAIAASIKGLRFVTVDIDQNKSIAEECGVKSLPLFQFYEDSNLIHSFIGADKKSLKHYVLEMTGPLDEDVEEGLNKNKRESCTQFFKRIFCLL